MWNLLFLLLDLVSAFAIIGLVVKGIGFDHRNAITGRGDKFHLELRYLVAALALLITGNVLSFAVVGAGAVAYGGYKYHQVRTNSKALGGANRKQLPYKW